jgi:hypothetical protein
MRITRMSVEKANECVWGSAELADHVDRRSTEPQTHSFVVSVFIRGIRISGKVFLSWRMTADAA